MAREYSLEKTRNIGIMAHIDAGKTTCTERILFHTHKIHKIGETHDGESQMDWMEQEQERGITITSAATTAYWNGYRLNIIDTPGHVDFTVEVQRSLRVLDGAVALIDAQAGVEPQTETVWRQATEYNVPRMIFANKMDKMGADFEFSLKSIEERLGVNAKPIEWPIGAESDFNGVIDLVTKTAYKYDGKPEENAEVIDIPADLVDIVEEKRNELIEAVAEFDDDLMTKYLEGEEVSVEEIKRAIVFEDSAAFTKASGIGKKTAQRIVLELKDHYGSADIANNGSSAVKGNTYGRVSISEEAINALMELGYTRNEAADAVAAVNGENLTIEDYIRAALRNF